MILVFIYFSANNTGQMTFFQAAQDELQLGQRVDADQVGLHLLAGLLCRLPVVLFRGQLVAAGLEGLPAHVALVLLPVGPRVWGGGVWEEMWSVITQHITLVVVSGFRMTNVLNSRRCRFHMNAG